MIRITLKSILSKKNEACQLVLSLIEQMHAHISIEDEKGALLCGNTTILSENVHPVTIQSEVIGNVKGDEKAMHIASLLSLLAKGI